MKRAQFAVEFILYLTVALIIFLLMYAVFSAQQVNLQQSIVKLSLLDVGQKVQSAFYESYSLGDGASKNISLASSFMYVNYSIYVSNTTRSVFVYSNPLVVEVPIGFDAFDNQEITLRQFAVVNRGGRVYVE